jgi:rod shape-determining protein MreC
LEVVAFILICNSHEYQQSAVWSSANKIIASIENTTTQIKDYFQLSEDNAHLAAENARLKNELMLLNNLVEHQIERDSQYIYTHLDWNYIPAKVIGSSVYKQHNYLTINKGTRDGIQEDMGVICNNGVVGIVSTVGEKYAIVVPIIHQKISLSCRLKNNGQIIGTHWDGKDYRMVSLTEIPRHVSVYRGDTVVSSGLTPIFPEGIMVGIVDHTLLNEGDNYHKTLMQLSTNYKTLKYVQVLHNANADIKLDQE